VGGEHWVQPLLVAEVAFAEWTPDGHVRHASFKGLRTDKPAGEIIREAARTAAAAPAASPVKVTNPERVIDPMSGITKLDLVRYYESVADWMLPHLKDRPLSMVRAPNGITEELFFQKHPETRMPGLKEHDPDLWPCASSSNGWHSKSLSTITTAHIEGCSGRRRRARGRA
jgi:bifunctional non-homologous end joining protein LigD